MGDTTMPTEAKSQPDAGPRPLTTTHAAWGAGHPRLLVVSGDSRSVHEIDCDLTHIGSSQDSDLVLEGTDPLHAKILHDTNDEYVLTMVGAGETSAGRHETLRTGSQFTAGPWRLVFARDEFADHGRPYGGRNGGEWAHQRRQPPRPDYAREHPASSLTRCELKQAGQGSAPETLNAMGRAVLADPAVDTAGSSAPEFRVVNDAQVGVYEAIIGDEEIGGVTYNLVGADRIVLLAVAVLPEFRGRGIAVELIRRVLDDIRAQGRTVTNFCPIVASFFEQNPGYVDLIDAEHPGVVRGRLSQ
jgi:predicted GNAT family acetyltransferase